jgi:hypothetical protein
MIFPGFLLGQLNFVVLNVPNDDAAHTRQVVHVVDNTLLGNLVSDRLASPAAVLSLSKVNLLSSILV